MITSIASLMLAGAVLSQTTAPKAPTAPAAPVAPIGPDAPIAPTAPIAPSAPIALDIAMALQFPVPPVPPVPPRDPRQKPRERDRRRVPEGWVESTEPFSRTLPVSKGATLMLSNIAGNIQVSAGTAERIEVEALKHAWGPNAEQAKQRLSDALIETYATGNRVELRVEHSDRRDARAIDVEFSVKVPSDAMVDLRTVSGDVRVTNVKGEVRVQGVSGNLALEGTARLVAAKTVSGGITIANAGADASLSLSTVNGDLLIQTLNTRALDVNTVNGDVRISGWSGDRAHIRTLDGDLDLQTSLMKGGRYEIDSHSGNINLSLPEQPGFELEAHTFSGRIRIDFPIRSEGPIRDTDRGPRSVRGTYGDGSSSLRLQTFNGNLTVTRR
jgi:Putative adhesin